MFAISGKLLGSLDLEDLASASQDGSISRLISTPTPSMFSFREFFSVIDHPQFLNVYIWQGKTLAGFIKFATTVLHCILVSG